MISQGIEPMKLFLKLKRIQPPTHICNMVHDLSRALLTVTYQDLFGPELWQDIWSCRADDDQGCIRKWSKSNSQQPCQDHWRLDKNSLKSAPPMLFFLSKMECEFQETALTMQKGEKVYSFIEKSRLYFMFSKTEDESKRVRGSLWKSFWWEKYLKSSKYADNNFWL